MSLTDELSKVKWRLFENWYVRIDDQYTPLSDFASDRIFLAEHNHFTDLTQNFYILKVTEEDEEGWADYEYVPVPEESVKLFKEIENALDQIENVSDKLSGLQRRTISKIQELLMEI